MSRLPAPWLPRPVYCVCCCTAACGAVSRCLAAGVWIMLGDRDMEVLEVMHIMGSILFANHKANGVVTNIGLSR